MQTLETRIVACARSWIGTRFQHQGRLKRTHSHKGGVDCLGLLAGVAEELNLCGCDGRPLAALDRADYGHLPDGTALHAALAEHLLPCKAEELPPASIVLIALENVPRHLAIISEMDMPHEPTQTGMIHAYAQARKVVEHPLDDWWRARICAAFRVPNQ